MSGRKDYSYIEVQDLKKQDNVKINDHVPVVDDVVSVFCKIRRGGDYLAAWDGDQIPWGRYAMTEASLLNHFQGMQRLHKGNYMLWQVRQEQVLIQITAYQSFLVACAVEESFPSPDLACSRC